MPLLGYPRWNEFKASIEKAKIACQNSQNNVVVHFSASILKNAKGKPSGAMESLSNPVLRWEGFCDRKDVTI